MRRHGVQDFVRNDGTAPLLGRRRDPIDAPKKIGNAIAKLVSLAFGQIGTHLQQPIALRQRRLSAELLQHIGGEPAAAGPELDHVPIAHMPPDVGQLMRDAAAE